MLKHITPLPRPGQTGPEAADPPRRASRFDERGIALQTIIIMVVLLAIAGAVAAVMLTRAGEETGRLEETDSAVYGIENATGCRLGGGNWITTAATTDQQDAITRAGRSGTFTGANNAGWCSPS